MCDHRKAGIFQKLKTNVLCGRICQPFLNKKLLFHTDRLVYMVQLRCGDDAIKAQGLDYRSI